MKKAKTDKATAVLPMLEMRAWDEFQNSGLLWFINTILHAFGWAIVIERDNGKFIKAFPARTKFRGFSEKVNDNGYLRITEYMVKHANELLQEVKEEEVG